MKFRLYSDIHTEFGKFNKYPKDECSDIVLLLAGDIGVGLDSKLMLLTMCKHYKAVVMTCGNHEYYHRIMDDIDSRYRDMSDEIDNFHYLQNSTAIIDGVRFIGGTMWTDLNKGDWSTCFNASQKMNDYHYIRYFNEQGRDVRLTTDESRSLHRQFKIFLESELQNSWVGDTVVVTHHSPCEMSVSEFYKGTSLNAAYYEDMTEYMFLDNAPAIWVHGHIHSSSDYTVGNTRILANPRGYVGVALNTTFDINLTFEL